MDEAFQTPDEIPDAVPLIFVGNNSVEYKMIKQVDANIIPEHKNNKKCVIKFGKHNTILK